MKSKSIGRGRIMINVALQVAAVAGVIVAVNYYAFNNFKRWDVSRDEKHELSEQTRGLLRRLKDDVQFIALFQGENILGGDVANLLKEYLYESKRKVSIESVNPTTSYERALDLKREYEFELNEDVIIVVAKGRHKIVSAHQLAEFDTSGMARGERPRIAAFLGERVLTSALLELLEGRPAIVYSCFGHGEPDAIVGGEMSRVVSAVIRQNIVLQPLPLAQFNAIPENADAVILAGPQNDLSNQDIDVLTAYWARGGRLFIFLWNGAVTPNLDRFLAGRGVFPRKDQVVLVAKRGVAVSKIRDVAAIPSGEHPVTRRYKDLSVSLLGRTQSLELGNPPPSGLTSVPILTTYKSSGYWGETDIQSIETDRLPVYDPNTDAGGSLTVAAAIEQAGPRDERIELKRGRIIVVGNAFCVYDTGLTANTLDFISSGLNWLLDRSELVGITAKPANEFPPNLSDDQLRSVLNYVVLIMPACAAVLAVVVWFMRRR